jgi:hypothetical protein
VLLERAVISGVPPVFDRAMPSAPPDIGVGGHRPAVEENHCRIDRSRAAPERVDRSRT